MKVEGVIEGEREEIVVGVVGFENEGCHHSLLWALRFGFRCLGCLG